MNAAAAPGAAAPGVAVLCTSADAPAVGGAVGLALAAGRPGAGAIVSLWDGQDGPRVAWPAPALPAARRLTASLVARGLPARATARLAVLWLPGPAAAAATAAMRAAAAGARAPVVTVVGGPRAGAFDDLLDAQDLVLVAVRAGADPTLARRAVARLLDRGVDAAACTLPAGVVGRALAAAGLGLAPALRREVSAPLRRLLS